MIETAAQQLTFETVENRGRTVANQIALELRGYQEECRQEIHRLHKEENENRLIAQLATGGGKTIIFSAVTVDELGDEELGEALILAHRDELLTQAAAKLRMVWPSADIGRVQAERNETGHQVTISSVQTLYRENRFKQAFPQPNFLKLLITDEAHHVAAATYQMIYDRFGLMKPRQPGAPLHLGVTATPIRGDKESLGNVYDRFAYKWSIKDGITSGYLVDLKGYVVAFANEDFGDVHIKNGDYDEQELAKVLLNVARNEAIVNAWKEQAKRETPHQEEHRQTVVFCLNIEHAESVAAAFSKAGIRSDVIHSKMDFDRRRKVLADFEDRKLKVICNCMVLTEGWDNPSVECVVMARPTRNSSLYIQCLDAQTEILTPSGWKNYTEIKKGDLVAGFDTTNSEIQWVKASKKYVRPLGANEEMYAISSPSLDIRVTGGHRMVYRTREGREHTKSAWKFITAEELAKRSYEYEIPLAGHHLNPGVRLTDDELRFIGWYLTDGTLNRTTNQILISQAAHQPTNEAIVKMLEGCGFKYGISEIEPKTQYHANSNSLRYYISKGQPRGKNKDLSGWGRLENYIDKNLSPLLEAVNRRQLGILLEAIHLGDGCKQLNQSWERRSYHIITGNKVFAERLQSLCVRLAYKCNVSITKRETGEYYVLHIKDTDFRAVSGAKSTDRPIFRKTDATPGEIVWCVENQLSTLVIRRNGKVAVVGNCVGRGTRLFPQGGKQNCLILDVADVSSKTRLHIRPQTLDKVLGISKEGEEKKKLESAKQLLLDMDGGSGNSKYKFRETNGGKGFNPLADPFEDNPLLSLRWSMGGSGLTLSLPKKYENSRHFIVIKRRKDMLFDVVHIRQNKEVNAGNWENWVTSGEKFVNPHGLPDESAAALFAEKYAASICPEVSYRSKDTLDRMHERPATGKQMELLQKKGQPIEIEGRRVTMAEASAMLDAVFAKKIKAKLDRPAEQLELY